MNRASKICTVTRIGRLCDAILVTDDGFGPSCVKVTQNRLGEGWVGRGGGRRTENQDHVQKYIYIYVCVCVCVSVCM